jgi:RHS repeat-associated protein
MQQINFKSSAMVKTLLSLCLLLSSITQVWAQRTITGPTSVLVGSTEQYTVTAPAGKIPSLVITLSNRGSASYPTQDPYSSNIYYIDVYWHTVGTDQIKVFDQDDIAIVTSPTVTINGQAVGPVSISGGVTSRCMGSGSTAFSASASNATSYSWSITSGAGSISNGIVTWSPSFSGIATISVTAFGAGGSSSNSSKNVTVNAPGTISITSNQPWQICQGTYARLTASGGTSYYEWDVVSSEGSQHFSGVSYIDVNPNVNTTYYLYGNESTCNSAQSTSQTITVVPLPVIQGEINPSGFSTRCQGNGSDSFTVVANNASSYTWSVSPPSAGTMSGSTITWSNSFSGTAVISVNAFGCNSSSASKSKSITVAALPSSANAGPDQLGASTCGTSSVSLAANTPTVGSGTWSIISGSGGYFVIPGTLTSPNSTTSFTGVAGSSYTLRWTISNSPCASTYDDVIITFNRNPTAANAGPDQTSSATCGLTSITLAGNAPAIGSGVWSIVNGNGGYFVTPGVTTSTNRTSGFSGVSGSTYTLRWTISSSPCTSSIDDMIVTFNASPTVANAGPDQTSSATCGLTSVTLAANAPSVGAGNWTIVSGTGGYFVTPGVVTSTNRTSSFSGVAGSTYTLRWSISNLCSTSTDDVIVTFNRTPTAANAGVDQTGSPTCGLTTITLAGNAPTIGSGVWSIISGTGGYFVTPGLVTSSNRTSSFSGVSGSTYTLRWTISNAPCAASIDDVLIKFNSSATVANAGPDQINSATCGLTSVALAANAPTAGTGSWSIVSGTGGYFVTPGVITSTNRTSSFSGVIGSAYTLRWTITNSLCQSIDDVNITFNKNPSANAGVDLSVWAGTSNGIGGSPTAAGGVAPYSYSWSPSTGLSSSATSNPTVMANNSNTYTVTITDSKGCQRSDAAIVSVTAQPIITASGTTVVLGSSVQLEGNTGFTTYQWLKNGTEVIGNVRQISVNAPAQYTLKVTKTGVTGFGTASINILTGANDENYILANNPLVEIYNTANLVTVDVNQFARSIQYFDGLGRPMQTVSVQGSPGLQDIVQPVVYDAYGRENKKYLPFVAQNNGAYKPNDEVIDVTTGNYKGIALPFYSAGAGKVAQDNRPFSETIFEPSPLNRPDKQYGAGQSWAPTAAGGNDKYNQYGYETNVANEVLLWTFTYPSEEYTTTGTNAFGKVNAGTASSPVYYSAAELTKNKTKDEEGNQLIEYIDKQGKTILKRVQAVAGSPSTTDINKDVNYSSTYYIYDDLKRLVCVIPPEATRLLATKYYHTASTDAIKNTFLKAWAFRYRYDGRGRMSAKQVPGAEPVFMVYDNRDRLVLTQDGNQRNGSLTNWTFTKYDVLNRPILTGIYTHGSAVTQGPMQGVVDNHYTVNPTSWSETFSPAGVIHGYSNLSFPQVTNPDLYLTVTYYDNYDFKTLFASPQFDFVTNELQPGSGLTGQETVTNSRVIGQVTGGKVRMLATASWLKSVNYYDDRYRVIQSIAENTKGHEVTTNVYDFVGKVLRTKSSLYAGQPAVWTSVVNTTINGELLTGTSTTNWNAGAVSSQTLAGGVDGWTEFTVVKTTPHVTFGMSDVNTNNTGTTIDFNWRLSGTVARPCINGAANGTDITVSPGDILRIERVNGKIYWKRNGVVVFPTSTTVPSATLLMADVAFYNNGSTISNVRLSPTFSNFAATPQTITQRFVYDHGGRLLESWHQMNGDTEILIAKNQYNELGQLVDKDLHSANGSPFRQSIDYRYNIRGWLTRINNSDLAIEEGETKDYYGMNLFYNTSAGTSNNALYNGNISALKWSNSQGVGTIKESAYNFDYDPLNRLLAANHKQSAVPSVWTVGLFDEKGITYDLNGNIKTLQRRGDNGVQIDNLVYNYNNASNKLLSVADNTADATNKLKGFKDGNTSGNDYSYDANGNMTLDKNKGITSAISYNHLNLPELVTRSTGNVRYLYDATGAKRGQVVTMGNSQKVTEYIGPWVFENGEAQFVSHSEGRVVLTNTTKIYAHSFDDALDLSATSGVTLASETINGEKYLKVTGASGASLASKGLNQIGGPFAVAVGDQITLRVKGYRNAQSVNLLIKGASNIVWPGANLPATPVNEGWAEAIFEVPTGVTSITVGVLWNSTNTAGDYFYLNELELIKSTASAPEYQYNLKDHLGNVRLTFTSKDEVDINTATLETANLNTEQSQFLRINNAKRINASIFDHTNGAATGYSERLNGSANEKYGVAKSISVMPGDVITAEVYAKYVDPTSSNWTGALTTLMSQIAANTAGVVVDGASYTSSTASFPPGFIGLQTTSNNGAPRAYLNWLVFDRNYGFITGGFKQITTAAKEAGSDVPHELLQMPAPITITQPGYVYIYLSNESLSPVEVYFDDFKVIQTKSPVIQLEDYYPFGLTFNSYSRENSTKNNYLYNGKELQDELDLGWLHYGARMYTPESGRWFSIDPKAEEYDAWSPYHYVYNNPVKLLDPDGREIINGAKQGSKEYEATESALSIIQKTNPEAYNTLQNSATKYNVTYAQLNPDEAYQAGYIGDFTKGNTDATFSAKKGLGATNIQKDKNGDVTGADFERLLTMDEQESSRAEGKDPSGVKKTISEGEAGEFVSISGDVEIRLDVSLLKGGMKELTSILGHEFGHASFTDQNKALAYLWSLIRSPDAKGHDKNNPSGKRAIEEENKTRSGYGKAKKDKKDEEK